MNNRGESEENGGWTRRAPYRLVLVTTGVLVTLVAFGLATHVRLTSSELPPLSSEKLPSTLFDPGLIGIVFPVIVVPTALIYLLSTTRLFRQALGPRATTRDRRRLFAGFATVLSLSLAYDLVLTRFFDQPPLVNPVVIIAGGLVGGWRLGLVLGAISMLFHGTLDVYSVIHDLADMVRVQGGQALVHIPWGRMILWHYVTNLWASSNLWTGCVAGLGADLLGRHRFSPALALVLGSGVDLGSTGLKFIGGAPPGPPFALATMIVTGLAMATVALMVRSVQAETAQREARTAELARTQAELRALRAQINPHFLFNAINTIRYFVRTDPDGARRLLLHLSEVFQRALRCGEFVDLQGEVDHVEAYLALEKARLGPRLQVAWSIEREMWLDHPVPTLILQPVVENAVIHGVARQPEGGTVRITVQGLDGDLVLRVEDDGPGISPERLAQVLAPANPGESQSIGLRNVDSRLRVLYGEPYGLQVTSEAGQGTSVEIRVPLEKEAL